DWPDVRRVIDEILRARGFVRIRQADYLAAFRFSENAPKRTLAVSAPAPAVAQPSVAPALPSRTTPRTVWVYWEGPMPGYIELCCQTIRAHNQRVEVLDRAGFDALFRHDRDILIDT